jgi:putative transposase
MISSTLNRSITPFPLMRVLRHSCSGACRPGIQGFSPEPTLDDPVDVSDAVLKMNQINAGIRIAQRLVQAIHPGPKTSQPHPRHKIYPYLLRNLSIDQANQVWASDITYLPMENGFIYLTVIMDWYSRKVLSWRLSNSMDSSFCVDALEEAIHRYGKPEIFNTDQGSQYTSEAFTDVLKDNDIEISMDGKGAWRDNVFVERLWRSVKYEEVYLNAYESMTDARQSLKKYFEFYNQSRKHQTLKATPDRVYYESISLPEAA